MHTAGINITGGPKVEYHRGPLQSETLHKDIVFKAGSKVYTFTDYTWKTCLSHAGWETHQHSWNLEPAMRPLSTCTLQLALSKLAGEIHTMRMAKQPSSCLGCCKAQGDNVSEDLGIVSRLSPEGGMKPKLSWSVCEEDCRVSGQRVVWHQAESVHSGTGPSA